MAEPALTTKLVDVPVRAPWVAVNVVVWASTRVIPVASPSPALNVTDVGYVGVVASGLFDGPEKTSVCGPA